MFFYPFSRG